MVFQTRSGARRCSVRLLVAAVFLGPVGVVNAQQAGASAELQRELAQLRLEQQRAAEKQRALEAKLRALEAAAASEASSVSLLQRADDASNTRLKVSGDLRLRAQGDYSDDDARSRDSAQVRARLGATYEATDRVTIGARLVTGDSDDPNSSDVQLSNFVDDLEFSLDLAYAKVSFGDLDLYGGKIPQPFARTDLVWDSDVNPQGLGAVYKRQLRDGSQLRFNSLFFIVDEQAVAADSTMVGAQVGWDSPVLGDWQYDFSIAYYDYRIGSLAGADSGDLRSNLLSPDGRYLSDFDLGDVLIGVTWKGVGDRWPMRLLADYVKNFGAKTDADSGFGIDLSAGRVTQPGDWRVTYGYSTADTDAVLAAFSHDNIGIATNYRLHSLTLDYVPMPKTLLTAIWYHYRPDSTADAGANDVDDWLDRIRIAFLVSF